MKCFCFVKVKNADQGHDLQARNIGPYAPNVRKRHFSVSELLIFMGETPDPTYRQGFAPWMLTMPAFRPGTRTYLPFEINLKSTKYSYYSVAYVSRLKLPYLSFNF